VKRYELTPRAQNDIDEIADFSLAKWGEQQTERYIAALESRFEWLSENPLLGRPRDEIAPNYRSFRQGSHVIFYIVLANTVVIIGVPHMSRDIDAYFNE
jgi:toxin ParE1/3/4